MCVIRPVKTVVRTSMLTVWYHAGQHSQAVTRVPRFSSFMVPVSKTSAPSKLYTLPHRQIIEKVLRKIPLIREQLSEQSEQRSLPV